MSKLRTSIFDVSDSRFNYKLAQLNLNGGEEPVSFPKPRNLDELSAEYIANQFFAFDNEVTPTQSGPLMTLFSLYGIDRGISFLKQEFGNINQQELRAQLDIELGYCLRGKRPPAADGKYISTSYSELKTALDSRLS